MSVLRGLIATGFVFSLLAISSPALASALGDASTRRVTIHAGDITLGATLYRPAGAEGQLPAIVTVHGSAPSTRDDVGFYTNAALKMGFAVLSFDKRGVGESTGSYVQFSVANSESIFDKLALDVVYSVRWLSQQSDIDAERIGLFGGSQAGWIMPLATARESKIKFFIAGEGTPVTAGEEWIHGQLSGEGQQGWNFDLIRKADEALESYTGDHGFNPEPTLNDIAAPSLWLFGLYDDVIPVYPSISRLRNLIIAGKKNMSIHVYPFGDHNFSNTATGERYDISIASEQWLKAIGILDSE